MRQTLAERHAPMIRQDAGPPPRGKEAPLAASGQNAARGTGGWDGTWLAICESARRRSGRAGSGGWRLPEARGRSAARTRRTKLGEAVHPVEHRGDHFEALLSVFRVGDWQDGTSTYEMSILMCEKVRNHIAKHQSALNSAQFGCPRQTNATASVPGAPPVSRSRRARRVGPELLGRAAARRRRPPRGGRRRDAWCLPPRSHSDASHNRSVLTMAGEAPPWSGARGNLEVAVEHPTWSCTAGSHADRGVDVVPFVALGSTTWTMPSSWHVRSANGSPGASGSRSTSTRARPRARSGSDSPTCAAAATRAFATTFSQEWPIAPPTSGQQRPTLGQAPSPLGPGRSSSPGTSTSTRTTSRSRSGSRARSANRAGGCRRSRATGSSSTSSMRPRCR